MEEQRKTTAKQTTQKDGMTKRERLQARFIDWANKWLPYEFAIDEENEELFELLWDYFTGGELPKQYSHAKGWLICGPPGTGKTDMLRVFQRGFSKNKEHAFKKREVWRICQDFAEIGENAFGPERISPGNWFFDELGEIEKELVSHYGNKLNIAERLIHERYTAFKSARMVTHLSTNLSAPELSQAYDEKIISRMREMCNIYALVGSDRRKKATFQKLEIEKTDDPLKMQAQTEEAVLADLKEIAAHIQEGGELPRLNDIQIKCYYDFLDKRGFLQATTEEKRNLYLAKKHSYIQKIGSNPILNSVTELKAFQELIARKDNPMPAKGNALEWAVILGCKRETLIKEMSSEDFFDRLSFLLEK